MRTLIGRPPPLQQHAVQARFEVLAIQNGLAAEATCGAIFLSCPQHVTIIMPLAVASTVHSAPHRNPVPPR
jgi:hypothetical protein